MEGFAPHIFHRAIRQGFLCGKSSMESHLASVGGQYLIHVQHLGLKGVDTVYPGFYEFRNNFGNIATDVITSYSIHYTKLYE